MFKCNIMMGSWLFIYLFISLSLVGSFFAENFKKAGLICSDIAVGKGLPPAACALWGSLLWENIKSNCFDFRVYLMVCVCVCSRVHLWALKCCVLSLTFHFCFHGIVL